MIRFFGISRHRIALGDRFSIQTQLEETDDSRSAASDWPVVVATLIGDKSYPLNLKFLTFLEDFPGIRTTAFGVRANSAMLAPGPYEVELRVGDSVATLDSKLWIAPDELYKELLDEELATAQGKHFSFAMIEPREPFSPDLLREMVERAFSERLGGLLIFGQRLEAVPKIEFHFGGSPALSGDPLVYFAELFADQCRDLLFLGVEALSVNVSFFEARYRLAMSAELKLPLDDETTASLNNGSSELFVASAMFRNLFPQALLAAKAKVWPGERIIEISLEIGSAHYSTAGTAMSYAS